jgi:hypothetical protein
MTSLKVWTPAGNDYPIMVRIPRPWYGYLLLGKDLPSGKDAGVWVWIPCPGEEHGWQTWGLSQVSQVCSMPSLPQECHHRDMADLARFSLDTIDASMLSLFYGH